MLERVSQRLGLRRATQILQSTLVQVPVVAGYFRPVILVPMSVISGLPASQLEAILAHELAHIRRHDYLVNLLQTLVETVFFYHPGVWWLSRQIRNERENCCDDLAVAVVGSGVDYGPRCWRWPSCIARRRLWCSAFATGRCWAVCAGFSEGNRHNMSLGAECLSGLD